METKELDLISEIGAKKSGKRGAEGDEAFSSEDDDLLDEMAVFVEGQDLELAKDRSNLLEDDDKVKKLKEMRQRGEHLDQPAEEEKKERPKTGPGSNMAARPRRDDKSGRYAADGGEKANKDRIKEKQKAN